MVQQWRPRSNGNGQRDAGRRHGDAEAGESAEEGTRREETGDDAESSHEPAGDMHNEDAEQVVAGYEQDWDWNDGWYGNGWNGNRSQNYWNWNTDPWSETGWGTRRGSNVSRVEETTLVRDGKWHGNRANTSSGTGSTWGDDGAQEDGGRPSGNRSNEKLVVPEFSGEGSEAELGRSARSYLRKVAAWLKCTRMPEKDRGVALYTNLSGRAWVFAEELDVDLLASSGGVAYFQDWIRVRFMEMEVTKVSNVMAELFRRCRKRPEQAVRDFNVEFERLLLHLKELDCELPGLVKAWLYLDKLKVSEAEELALLSSVHNQYDVKLLQQAAILHDRGPKRTWEKGNPRWSGRGGGGSGFGDAKSVHVTNTTENMSEDEAEQDFDEDPSDAELVSETVAEGYHSAYMAFQDAKSRYREAMKGRGVDPGELKKRSEERLRAAKAKSFCAACKRRGHWHRDQECPLRGRTSSSTTPSSDGQTKNVQVCNHVQMCYMAMEEWTEDMPENDIPTISEQEGSENVGGDGNIGRMLAITDTACTKAVAGHLWYEQYCRLADHYGWEVEIIEERDRFKFGASRIHESHFAVNAVFAIERQPFKAKIAIVQCDVPLLFSRAVLVFLGMTYNVVAQKADLRNLELQDVPMETSPTGHPALIVSDYPGDICQQLAKDWTTDERVQFPILDAVDDTAAEGAYKERNGDVNQENGMGKTLFYPKKISIEVENMLTAPSLSKVSFYTWWKTANQSRDFWIETHDMLFRVHVSPRKNPFDPSGWKTPLRHLRDQLLEMLGEARYTEVIPCHAEGLHKMSHEGLWRSEKFEYMNEDDKGIFGNLWIGRSCFRKSTSKCREAHAQPVSHACAVCATTGIPMENAPGEPGERAGGLWSAGASSLDGTGIAADLDRTAGGQIPEGRVESSHGFDKAQVGGAHCEGKRAGHRGAGQADQGAFAEDDPGVDSTSWRTCHDLRQVPELALPGSPGGVHGLGSQRGESKQQLLTGSEAVRKVGTGRDEYKEESCKESRAGLADRGPGSEGSDRSAGCVVGEVVAVVGQPSIDTEINGKRQEAVGRNHRGAERHATGPHRGRQGGTNEAGDQAGSDEAEISTGSSWVATVIDKAKSWVRNGLRSHDGDVALRDFDVVAENDKAVGLGSEVEKGDHLENNMTVGHSNEVEYDKVIGHGSETEYKGAPEEAFVMEVEHESDSEDCRDEASQMTPRQKAQAGIRRRKDAKKPVRKKLMAMGRK